MEAIRAARKANGLILREELRAAGVAGSTITTWRARNQLVEVLPLIYRVPGESLSWLALCEAAAHWAGPEGALSHFTAAALLGLPQFIAEEPIHVLVPKGTRRPKTPGVRLELHFQKQDKREFSMIGGLRVTSLSRTLIDLAGCMSEFGYEIVLEDVIQRRLISRDRLDEVHARRKGGWGTQKFTNFINVGWDRLQPVDSVLERKFLDAFVAGGLETVPQTRYLLSRYDMRYLADFAFPEQRLLIEVDGYKDHSTRAAWAKDVRKNNHVVSWGWSVLRFTSEALDRPDVMVDLIRQALFERGWVPPSSASPRVGTKSGRARVGHE